nr:MAG TPA: hypothetical protein [Bacteriophage sp.]
MNLISLQYHRAYLAPLYLMRIANSMMVIMISMR